MTKRRSAGSHALHTGDYQGEMRRARVENVCSGEGCGHHGGCMRRSPLYAELCSSCKHSPLVFIYVGFSGCCFTVDVRHAHFLNQFSSDGVSSVRLS